MPQTICAAAATKLNSSRRLHLVTRHAAARRAAHSIVIILLVTVFGGAASAQTAHAQCYLSINGDFGNWIWISNKFSSAGESDNYRILALMFNIAKSARPEFAGQTIEPGKTPYAVLPKGDGQGGEVAHFSCDPDNVQRQVNAVAQMGSPPPVYVNIPEGDVAGSRLTAAPAPAESPEEAAADRACAAGTAPPAGFICSSPYKIVGTNSPRPASAVDNTQSPTVSVSTGTAH
jgi:hypothetical protein